MQKGLVSIITPCYNTGNILHRLLDSVLSQDYPNVEMYAINDGSNDNTEEVIKGYMPKFQKRGYELHYVYQENSGQSVAINNGLKIIKGEYLVWPDSDDYYRSSHALSIFVEEFKKHDANYGAVRSIPTYIDEKTFDEQITDSIPLVYYNEYQFENCLYSINFFWGAGNYMVRMSAFDMVNPSREIYVEKNAGQNWQMLLPLLYSYKCITIKESLLNVLKRETSHSRGQFSTYEQQLVKFNSYQNTVLNTLDNIHSMPDDEREEYKRIIRRNYKIIKFNLAIQHCKSHDIQRLKQELSSEGYVISKKKELGIVVRQYHIGRILLDFIIRVRQWL